MNAIDHEISLLRHLRAACQQIRQRSSMELAEAALKRERKLSAEIERLEERAHSGAEETAEAAAA
jgi:hypothetical protein